MKKAIAIDIVPFTNKYHIPKHWTKNVTNGYTCKYNIHPSKGLSRGIRDEGPAEHARVDEDERIDVGEREEHDCRLPRQVLPAARADLHSGEGTQPLDCF